MKLNLLAQSGNLKLVNLYLCNSQAGADIDGPVFQEEYNQIYERFKNEPLIIEGPE